MKELTREELPDDGTHFVVTWTFNGVHACRSGIVRDGSIRIRSGIGRGFIPGSWVGCTNIRYWQFPEGKSQ